MTARPPTTQLRDAALLFGLYLGAAWAVMTLLGANSFVRFPWWVAGPTLYVVLKHGYRMLTIAFVAVILGNLVEGSSGFAMMAEALSQTIVLGCGAWAFRRLGDDPLAFHNVRDYLRLFGVAVLLGLLTLGIARVQAAIVVTIHPIRGAMELVTACAFGLVISLAPILAWRNRDPKHFPKTRLVEGVIILALATLVAQVVFLDGFKASLGLVARGYWMFLFVTLAALRLGTLGTVMVMELTAVLALAGAIRNTGFFSDDLARTGLTNFFSYMLSVSSDGLLVAILFNQGELARLQAEEGKSSLRASEERLRLMTSEVKDLAIISLDPSGCITSWNEGARRLKGYEAAEILGRSHRIMYTDGDCVAGLPESLLQRALQEGRTEDEGWRVRKDGSTFRADVVITAIRDEAGGLIGFTKITRDVSVEKAQAEQLRRSYQELERSNQDLEQFAYVASHDLRAPLRGIESLSLWLEEDLAGLLPPDSERNLVLMRNRVQRMQSLLDGILAYSRAGQGIPVLEEVDLQALARQLGGVYADDAEVRLEVDSPLVFKTAVVPFQQVLQNLVANAVKHHDRSCKTIRIQAQDQGSRYGFSVADDGPGIPAEFREKVFGLFQTLKPKDEVEGCGIGLAVVKKLVSRFRGRVWIESAEPRGARVCFTWPKAINQEEGGGT